MDWKNGRGSKFDPARDVYLYTIKKHNNNNKNNNKNNSNNDNTDNHSNNYNVCMCVHD